MLKSFVQTVATPRKKCGLVTPSSFDARGWTVTKVPSCWEVSRGMPKGYISFTVGANIAFTPWCW